MSIVDCFHRARHGRRSTTRVARPHKHAPSTPQAPLPTKPSPFHAHETIHKMSMINYRTIDIDALDPDSAANFDLSTLAPDVIPVSTVDVQTLAGQVRQLLRGGDTEGALRGALENAPYGADQQGKVRGAGSAF